MLTSFIAKTRLGDVEEELANVPIEYEYCPYIIEYGNDILDIDNVKVMIPDICLIARVGEYYIMTSDGYCGDFSLTLLCDIRDIDPKNYLYWEQDDIPTTIKNYLGQKAPANLLDLDCYIIHEERHEFSI